MTLATELTTCFYHNTANENCSGPHRAIRTDHRPPLEILAPGQTPIGTPVDQPATTEAFAILDELWDALHPGEPNPRLQ
jgi:hypothetical protein